MNRHPYPAYKPSGLEWLGEIPAHWELLEIKRLSPVKRGASPRPIDDPNYFDDKGDYSWVRISDVTSSKRYLEKTTQRLSSLGKSLSVPLKPGALFLSIAGSVGKPIITRINCCIHDGFVYFPQFEGNSEFLYYIFASGQPYGGLGKLGTQLNLNTDTVGAIHIGYPSYEEQGKIVAFLDRETTRIDALIEKKQKQLELLQEKRSALISHAVTKGLNPNAKMKASGVEWLGEIPEHWKTKRLKFVADISTGDKDTENNVEDGEYPFFVRSQTIERIDSYSFDGEAVLTAGDGVGVAKVFHYINGKFDFHQRVYKFSDFQSISGKFFFYYTRELFREEVLKLSAKSTVDSLRLPMIQDFVCCVPTLAEQAEIVEYMDRETGRIENAVSRIAKSITLLREYRTSLISAAVTGKIDVRKETA